MSKATTRQKGQQGEALAASWLQARGCQVLAANYRAGRAEIDLVCRHQNMVVFVEVKLRQGTQFGLPEEAVSPRKLALVQQAATAWQEQNQWLGPVRFDIVSIVNNGPQPEVFWLQDVG